MTPARVLLGRFALEAMLSSAPSASGRQIDALREGTQPNRDGWRGDALERRRQQYADLVLLTKDLNADELRVCRYRYGCTAGVESYRRLVTKWNLSDAMEYQCEVPIKEVAENADLCVVEGMRARLPGFQEISAALRGTDADSPYTPRQVKRLLESARQKVATAIKWRGFMSAIEERYE